MSKGGWLDSPPIQAIQQEFNLTDAEFLRLHFYSITYVSNWQRAYSSSILDLSDDELANYLGTFISMPFSKAWWRVVRAGYDRNFREAVDAVIEQWERRSNVE